MYYKILNDQALLDVLNKPQYLRRSKSGAYCSANLSDAQAICSSDGSTVWNIRGREPLEEVFETVRIVEIAASEYFALEQIRKEANSLEQEKQEQNTSEILHTDYNTLTFARECKIKVMDAECVSAITRGIVVKLSDGEAHHFELSIEDQINLLSLQEQVISGEPYIPYHETKKPCVLFSNEDFQTIIKETNRHKLYHTVYFNNLKKYINELNDVNKINDISYGMEIPEEYQTEALKSLLK